MRKSDYEEELLKRTLKELKNENLNSDWYVLIQKYRGGFKMKIYNQTLVGPGYDKPFVKYGNCWGKYETLEFKDRHDISENEIRNEIIKFLDDEKN